MAEKIRVWNLYRTSSNFTGIRSCIFMLRRWQCLERRRHERPRDPSAAQRGRLCQDEEHRCVRNSTAQHSMQPKDPCNLSSLKALHACQFRLVTHLTA
uniref:Uncharacterized protein n=1 Tax=Physcomitrium patens TaxID=3218 RepID=A0A2K1JCK7_PHYPA|nr:hypothetical protein PHYPA_019544 [Physcomitrium patens]